MTRIRPAYQAGRFYPADPSECRAFVGQDLGPIPELQGRLFGGVVPHAGWVFSGKVSLRLFKTLAKKGTVDRIVILGAVHVPGVKGPSVGDWDAWQTPLGNVPVDRVFERALVEEAGAEVHPRAHEGEHSIEVQVPLLSQVFPGVPMVPVAVPPSLEALRFGEALGRLLQKDSKTSYLIASSDLTHYGPDFYGFAPAGSGEKALEWAEKNDDRFLRDLALLDARGLLKEAVQSQSACGPGAVAAATEAAKVLGAKEARVLEHTNSYLVESAAGGFGRPLGPARNFVGYASAVFVG
ncbi:MAG TPA: AmmeMemoRadiSam system protein B [Planctomycetes bacterium]|nr:AmmeMemoRadiSam system protein B [Planctomycetota bacterium]